MRLSTKAALYSALVFPGAGLLLLKHYLHAIIFMVPAIAITMIIFRKATVIAQELSDKIVAGQIPFDIARIMEEVEKMTAQLHSDLNNLVWLFIICWGLSILSSYFAGKKIEANTTTEK